MSLSNLTSANSLQNLHQLYMNIASLNLPSQWNAVDTSHLYYRICNSQHFGLTDESASGKHLLMILTSVRSRSNWCYIKNKVQRTTLVKIIINVKPQNCRKSTLLSDRHQSVTIRSKQYHQRENNFVIRSIEETLEYMPENLVKVVITGSEHANLLVTLEDVGSIDFDYF
ncbi:3739_t:CDS:2 [Ambispora gerdemannii]|uniref:3739_t:CDS:1 n=1 Tax=Ambispora gerdemannii TaxID=144530 RepID=A0A9N9B0C6_9GLOM|nr:3739_t:CDS:2 [Ambispora gerdemannii]